MTPIDYLDLELAIGPGRSGFYAVHVLRSPSGEAQGELAWPWSAAELQRVRQDLQAAVEGAHLTQTAQMVRTVGETLFHALFSGAIGICYEASRATAHSQGRGLRIKLRIEPPELHVVPWELLFDPGLTEFLALSRQTPLVRYLAVSQPILPLAVEPPLRILVMAASPNGVAALDLKQEQVRLAAALAPLVGQRRAEIVWLAGQRWRDLQEAMQRGPWHVFHYIGHGAYDEAQGEGVLVVADDDGGPRLLSGDEFARLFDGQPALRLAVLNACEGARGDEQRAFSSLGSALVRRGLPAVIAMQYALSDGAAVEFSRTFYTALAAGLPVDAATSEARKALSLSRPQSLEWLTPVLFLRAPDGQLWPSVPPEPVTRAAPGQPAHPGEAGVHANIHIGGSATGSTIVVGTQLTMASGLPRATVVSAAEREEIKARIDHLIFAIRTLRGQVEGVKIQLAELQLQLLQNELTKAGTDQAVDTTILTGAGDWLLDNMPDLQDPLNRFFTSVEVRKLFDSAGPPAPTWLRTRVRG
jgi:hypothetical protein